MINAIAFTVPGEPQGKGRARSTSTGRHYTPAKTVAYEGLIAQIAQAAMRGAPLFEGACALELDIMRSIPSSWSQRKQQDAMLNSIRPTGKPDADNVLKACCDGMNGVVWKDDAQAVDVTVRKFYAATPGVRVWVAEL